MEKIQDELLSYFNENEFKKILSKISSSGYSSEGYFILLEAISNFECCNDLRAYELLDQFLDNKYEDIEMDIYYVLNQLAERAFVCSVEKTLSYRNIKDICLYVNVIEDIIIEKKIRDR
ncbi:MAG: hypothetical protein KAS32_09850 [Candidatus Peribacteraceae bacterium]|nr:hypothetical protein [Candidatus Peribacteraceae bacterium]